MRLPFNAVVVTASLLLGAAARTQSTPAPATPDSAKPASVTAAPADPAAAAPVPMSKRMACQSAVQGTKGQEQRDQMQLCLMQARLDCLKQAIDQKIIGQQRRDFMRSCVSE
jgi:hypothetical protein